MLTGEAKPKFTDITVIYPCRVVPFDSNTAVEVPFGSEVRVETQVAEELFGLKRAVPKGTFDKKVHLYPANKVRKEVEVPEEKPKAKDK